MVRRRRHSESIGSCRGGGVVDVWGIDRRGCLVLLLLLGWLLEKGGSAEVSVPFGKEGEPLGPDDNILGVLRQEIQELVPPLLHHRRLLGVVLAALPGVT